MSSETPHSHHAHPSPSSFSSTLTDPNTIPSATSSSSNDKGGFSRSSLGILLTFLGVFIALVVVSIFGHRWSRRLKERPRMWDIWLDSTGSGRHTGKWAEIVPVSAYLDYPTPPPPPALAPPPPVRTRDAPPQVPYALEHHIMMSQAWFRGVYPLDEPELRNPRMPPPPPSPPPLVPSPPTMRVAILIAMPSPARSHLRQNAPRTDRHHTEKRKGKTNVQEREISDVDDDKQDAEQGQGHVVVISASDSDDDEDAEEEEEAGGEPVERATAEERETVFGANGDYVLGMAELPWELGSGSSFPMS
ncbi:hypothetical protein EW146_g8400 [Bondarzewia mesenterica]|uniref:Uncharacterized protein n=1 Tax=Bondarzewia mesenterica TaxID=1095465 RepID=A0A4S4LEM4_9AGAM|nr:hypothetical protein EW146_g8400 [Bondarzewia mesenterica]